MEGGGSCGGEAFAVGRCVGRASAEKPPLFTPIIEFKTGPKPKTRPPKSQPNSQIRPSAGWEAPPPVQGAKRRGLIFTFLRLENSEGVEGPPHSSDILTSPSPPPARPQACISPRWRGGPLPHLNDPVAASAAAPLLAIPGDHLFNRGPGGPDRALAPMVGRGRTDADGSAVAA